MVADYERAKKREFTVQQMLRANKHVYNVRKAPADVEKKLMEQAGDCSDVNASVNLQAKTVSAIRRELRARLAESLAANKKEKAFAKMSLFDDRPRADELERLVVEYSNLHRVDWDAKSVKLGITCDLWRA